jgi:hypothetical protein
MRIKFAALRARGFTLLCLVPFLAIPGAVQAQTDYFNTDRGRPLHVQDAIAIERYAFELQAAPLRWSRSSGARVVWSVEPERAYGGLPRTQVELGVPVFVTEGFDGGSRSGLGAVHLSVLHALNVETLGLPALAVNGAVSIPAGGFGPRRAYTTLGVLATRTTSLGRVHLNVDWTLGDAIPADDSRWDTPHGAGLEHLSRWLAGVASIARCHCDRCSWVPNSVARQPIRDNASVDWQAAGEFWQLDPQWAFDAGLGQSLGDDPEWSLTFGAARSFGLLRFFPGGR